MDGLDLISQEVWGNDIFTRVKNSIICKATPVDEEVASPGQFKKRRASLTHVKYHDAKIFMPESLMDPVPGIQDPTKDSKEDHPIGKASSHAN